MPCPECENHRKAACDSAALRKAFNEAVELFSAVKSRVPFPEPYVAVWGAFYEAIRDHQAGLSVIKEIADLKAEVARLVERVESMTTQRL